MWQEDFAKILKKPGTQGNNKVIRRNHLFKRNNSTPPRQFLRDKIVLKNKLSREMLIEQIVEFESRGPGPPGRTSTPTTGYFHDKTKKLKKISKWINVFC